MVLYVIKKEKEEKERKRLTVIKEIHALKDVNNDNFIILLARNVWKQFYNFEIIRVEKQELGYNFD